MRRGIFKQLSFEDRFDRKYASWVKNNPKQWHKNKKTNIRKSRRILKKQLIEEVSLETGEK